MTSLSVKNFFLPLTKDEEESLDYELTLKSSPGRLALFAIIRGGLKGILIFFKFSSACRAGTDSFLPLPIVCINENLMHFCVVMKRTPKNAL